MGYDVDIISVPAQPVVSLRGPAPLSQIGDAMRRLREVLAHAGLEAAGPMTARFYDAEPGEAGRYEVAVAVRPHDDGSVPDTVGEAHGEWLPSHRALETVHRGPHHAMEDAWTAVLEACSALGLTPAGPMTEVYEVTRADGVPPERYVTRIRLPFTP